MTCPDENTFARVQASMLNADELVDFHRHLDTCPACLELAGALGCLYDAEPPVGGEFVEQGQRVRSSLPELDTPSVSPRVTAHARQYSRESLVAFGMLTAAHAYFSLALVPLFGRAWLGKPKPENVLPQLAALGSLQVAVVTYVIVWGLAGLLWAAVGWLGMLRQRRWAQAAIAVYAWLSVPSMLLAPLAWCVLAALQREIIARPPRRGSLA